MNRISLPIEKLGMLNSNYLNLKTGSNLLLALCSVLMFFLLYPKDSFAQDSKKITAYDKQFFIENKGQWPDNVLYLAKLNKMEAWITRSGVTYNFIGSATETITRNVNMPNISRTETFAVKMNLLNSNKMATYSGLKKSKAYFNYLLGSNKESQYTNISLYKEVVISDIYNGIDKRYYFENDLLRYDYIVKPGANPKLIQFLFDGANKSYINKEGNVCFETKFSTIEQRDLIAYQLQDNKKVKINAHFVQQDAIFALAIGNYDSTQNLIIDPIVYGTFIGGTEDQFCSGLKVGTISGDTYSVGSTTSSSFPVNTGPGFTPSRQGYIARLTPQNLGTGVGMVFCTFIGGTVGLGGGVNDNQLFRIILDNLENVYVVGYTTAANYPTTSNAVFTSPVGGGDAVVSVLPSTGNSLIYSTYFGGSDNGEIGYDIDLNPNNNNIIYITGSTLSLGLPDVPSGTSSFAGGNIWDGFAAAINRSMSGFSGIIYSRYLGTTTMDIGIGIGVDGTGNSYVTGFTEAITPGVNITTFPGTLYGSTFYPGRNIFLTSIAPNGGIVFSRVFGSDAVDQGMAIEVDANGDSYVVGFSQGIDYPITQGTIGASDNGVVSKFNINGNILNSISFGGISLDHINDAKRYGNSLWITGSTFTGTWSTQFATYPCPQSTIGTEGFVAELDNTSLFTIYAEKFGGSVVDRGWGVDFDGTSAYVGGTTNSPNFPTTLNCFDDTFNSLSNGNDEFVVRLIPPPSPFNSISASATPFTVCQGNIPINFTCNVLPVAAYTYLWIGPNFSSVLQNPVITNPLVSNSGIYTVTATNADGCSISTSVLVNVFPAFNAYITVYNSNPLQTNVNCDIKTMTAFPQGVGYTYQWTGTNQPGILGTTSSFDPSLNLTVSPYGTFTVVVTDANGCTSSSVITNLALPSATITATPSTIYCSGGNSILNATPTTYASYLWNPGNLNGNPVTVSPVVTTIYTLVVTDANGCKNTAFSTVTVLNNAFCCNSSLANNSTVDKLNNTSASQNMGTFIVGKTYFINGTFTIDQDMTFWACTFYFTANSKIVFTAGGINPTLTLYDCNFSSAPGCNMWDGIYVESADRKIDITDCDFSDMINGIKISSSAKISCLNSVFNNNKRSIYLLQMTNAANCLIEGNSFQKSGSGLIAPFLGSRPDVGIFIQRCYNLTIGNNTNPNSINTFFDLWTGINILFQGNSLGFNPTINLYNNRFIYINNSNAFGANTNNAKGWAINAVNNTTKKYNVNVFGNPSATAIHFEHCDKGINLIGVNAEVRNNTMQDVEIGVLMTQCAGRKYLITKNTITHTAMGICKNGDENTGGFRALENWIYLGNTALSSLPTLLPVGIISYYQNSNHIGKTRISGNHIFSPTPDRGIGIELDNGLNDEVDNNFVHFTHTTTASAGTQPPFYMSGIYCNGSQAPKIHHNIVDNNFYNNGSTQFAPGNNTGIYLTKCQSSNLVCNTTNYLQNGIFGVGANGSFTDFTLTRANEMRGLNADLLFWNLGVEGTLGQIGMNDNLNNIHYDANNHFHGFPLLNRVFRVTNCTVPFMDQIVTLATSLTQTQSSSSNTNLNSCKTIVTNPSSFNSSYSCGSLINFGTSADEEYTDDIIEDEVEYDPDFEECARRANEEMIYEWMRGDLSFRNANPRFDSFYVQHDQTAIGNWNRVNWAIAALSNDTLMENDSIWLAQWDYANHLNNEISIVKPFESNKRWINTQYLLALRFGMDTIIETAWGTVELLANNCPLIAGDGVFTARVLLGMRGVLNHYDDLQICNSMGIYKGGTSNLNAQLNIINNLLNTKQLTEMGIKVYPIPTSNSLTLEYYLNSSQTAIFYIFDMVGNRVSETTIYSNVTKRQINVSNLAQGLYTYQFVTNDARIYNGKIIIE